MRWWELGGRATRSELAKSLDGFVREEREHLGKAESF
jgi:rubrerythrin